MSRKVDHFEKGKYYQFTGHMLMFDPSNPDYSTSDDFRDIWFWKNWMDRQPRKCTYAGLNGQAAIFDDLYFKDIFYGKEIQMPWEMPASYNAYLKQGMFEEVEVVHA